MCVMDFTMHDNVVGRTPWLRPPSFCNAGHSGLRNCSLKCCRGPRAPKCWRRHRHCRRVAMRAFPLQELTKSSLLSSM
ncbi:hypothetical protein VUR80DRAFT_4934 [Thermomyces stellatus]